MTDAEAFQLICQHRLELVWNDDFDTVSVILPDQENNLYSTTWIEEIKNGDTEAALRTVVERAVGEMKID